MLPFLSTLFSTNIKKVQQSGSGFRTFYCHSQRKTGQLSLSGLCRHYLSSRSVSRQVFSAQVSLTSVFGMGTGGPSLQSTPTCCILTDCSAKIKSFMNFYIETSFSGRFLTGDPYGNRTHVTAVKGPCLNRLTNGPYGTGSRI